MDTEAPSALPPGYMKAETLLRVVPIVRSFETEVGKLTFASIDLFDDGSMLRYESRSFDSPFWLHEPFSERLWKHDAPWIFRHGTEDEKLQYVDRIASINGPLEFNLEDDVGTVYKSRPMGGSGDGERMRSEVTFTPAVPAAARTLRVVVNKKLFAWEGESVSSHLQGPPLLTLEVDL